MRFILPVFTACAFAIPISGMAATLTLDITYPAGANYGHDVYSNPFPQFDPALGTLTSYTLSVAGHALALDPFPPEIVFKDPGTGDAILDLTAAPKGGAIKGTGTTSDSGDLSAITGTGTVQFLAQDFSNRGGNTTTVNFTTDTLTYNYTPAVTSGVPEPSTWLTMALGFGALGYAGWRAQRKRVTAAV
jgi:hypothetical protein